LDDAQLAPLTDVNAGSLCRALALAGPSEPCYKAPAEAVVPHLFTSIAAEAYLRVHFLVRQS
jgi:hypothetical protein